MHQGQATSVDSVLHSHLSRVLTNLVIIGVAVGLADCCTRRSPAGPPVCWYVLAMLSYQLHAMSSAVLLLHAGPDAGCGQFPAAGSFAW
jgi:hypothetical protein